LLNARVHLVESVAESKRIADVQGTCVVIAPSGMCEFGRIVHHLARALDDARNVIAFVGYQGEHTLGRRIVEGVTPVRLLGRSVDVRASVVKMNGFSAHADARELSEALRPLAPTTARAFVVHGEPDQAEALASTMRGQGYRDVVVPAEGDGFGM
jgi:metallo-beta-lactamase family protein